MNYSLILVRNFIVNLQYYHGNLLYVSVARWQQSFFLKCYEWRCQGKKDALKNLNSQMSHQEGFYQLFLLKNSGSYELKL